ncbi:MAG: insulinase family protein [Planctomycetota bacterium]
MSRAFLNSLVFSVLAALCALVSASAMPPPDPDGLTRVRLECGLELWVHPVRATEDGSGEVCLSLVIRSGAIDEGDEQEGAAFVAKQAAGIDRPGIGPALGSRLRSGFAEDELAFTPGGRTHSAISHGLVEFRLVIDASDEDAWSGALAHARALVGGWRPSDAAFTRAVQMTGEREPPDSPMARARVAVVGALFEGHPIGERPLLPDRRTLAAVTPEAVRAYVRQRYVPSGSVLIVSGDIRPAQAIAVVRKEFEGLEARSGVSGPAALDVSALAGHASGHVIEGYPDAELSLIAFGGREDPDAYSPLDRLLLDRIAISLVSDRLHAEIAAGEPDLLSADPHAVNWLRGSRLMEVSVRCRPAGMRNAALLMGEAIAGIRAGGWTQEEFHRARASLLEHLKGEAVRFAELPAIDVLSWLVSAAMHGEQWTDPRAVYDHAVRLLATTTDERIAARAEAICRPDRLNVVAVAPEHLEGIAAVLRPMVVRTASATPRRKLAGIDAFPIREPAGELAEIAHDPATDVWSAVFGNGVVLRVRSMASPPAAPPFDPYARTEQDDRSRPDDTAGVTLRIAFCDGLVGEDASRVGWSRLAAAAWAYPSVSIGDAPAVRSWMRQRGIVYRAFESEQRFVLEVNAPPGGASDAMALATALIADPGVDPRFVDRARPDALWRTPALDQLGALIVGVDDPRSGPHQEGPVDPGAAGERLASITAAPIEASIVGVLDPEAVLTDAMASLGTLAPRARPRRPDAAWEPLDRSDRDARVTGHPAEYVRGVVFGDMRDLASVRPMVVASRVLDARIRSGAESLEGEARAWLWLGEGIPDRVTLVVRIAGDRALIESAPRMVDEAIESLVSGDLDQSILKEIDRARGGIDRAWERRSFWAARLSTLSWNGLDIGTLSGLPAAYGALTPERVRGVLSQSIGSGAHKRVTVIPETDAE